MFAAEPDPLRLPLLELIDTGDLPRTPPVACPYLPDRDSRSEGFSMPQLAGETYHELMDRGFRRSGRVFYRPRCESCEACVPIRIAAAAFRPSRSQRRCRHRNRDLTWRTGAPDLTPAKVDLYQRYLQHQHPGSPQDADADSLREFLYDAVVDTVEVTYLKDDRIIAASILDVCEQSVSSVYHYFDPAESRRSLGVFSVLCELELTRQWNVPYYYMGYWIAGSRTMDYKAKYRPHELLIDGQWRQGQ